MKNLLIVLTATLFAHFAWAAGEVTSPALPPVKGEVLEVKDADAFTYLRLKTANGETWAAVNKATVKKGAQVTINDPMIMQKFASKSLGRTFDTIVLGQLAGTAAAAAPVQKMTAPTTASAGSGIGASLSLGQVHGRPAGPTDVTVVKSARAEGPSGRTVAEVNAGRSALKDKPVAIRATAVKVTYAVMGKNWIHLRDGTGSTSDGSNDVLVTSKDEVKAGDVVLAKGTVRTDIDLGSGYAYKVLVEDAVLQK